MTNEEVWRVALEQSAIDYGSNAAAQVSDRVREAVTGYVNACPASFSFETPHIYVLNRALEPFAGLYKPTWSNALKCGFRPAWAELTARDLAHVEALNRP